MAKAQKLITSTLIGVIGLPMLSAHAQIETHQSTNKTPIEGESYFRYDIYQSDANVKPYLTCVTEKNCPQRTSKTLATKPEFKPVAEVVSKPPVQPLRGVYFAFGSSKLSDYEKNHLRSLAVGYKSKNVVYLRAYTDPVGGVDSQYNRNLAKNRATQVQKFLKKLGVKGQIRTEYNPPCCVKQGVTATSSDEERKRMRVVEIS